MIPSFIPGRLGEHRHADGSTVDRRGARDPEGFWARAASELPWFRPWDRVFEWTFPTFRWFIGAQTNLAYNALDHHVASGRGSHTALIYFNERGERRSFTLRRAARRRSSASPPRCAALGIGKGDRLTIYMPTSPGGDRPDARHGPHRRDPLGRVRRLRRARARATAFAPAARGSSSRRTSPIARARKSTLKTIVDEALAACAHAGRARRRAAARYASRSPLVSGPRHDVGRLPRARRRPLRRARARWRRTSRPTSSRRRARPRGRSWPFTRTAATRSTSPAWAAGASD